MSDPTQIPPAGATLTALTLAWNGTLGFVTGIVTGLGTALGSRLAAVAIVASATTVGAVLWFDEPIYRWREAHAFTGYRRLTERLMPSTVQCPSLKLDPLAATMQRLAEGTDQHIESARTDLAARMLELEKKLSERRRPMAHGVKGPGAPVKP